MKGQPPLSALRAFEAAARHGSLSDAGRELNVTHAAIAQQVKRLEQWFETPLLERQGRGVAPTEAGRELAVGLAEGFRMIAESVERLSTRNAARPLCITATPTFTANWLIPRLGTFRADYPDVELMIDPTSRLAELGPGGFDVAFRFGRGHWPGLDAVRLLASDIVIAASTALVRDKDIRSPEDLLALPRLQDANSEEWRIWFQSQGLAVPKGGKVINVPGSLVIDSIRQGLGIGMTARAWLEADLDAGRVQLLIPQKTDPDLGYYLVTPPTPARPIVKAFVKWARKAGEDDRSG